MVLTSKITCHRALERRLVYWSRKPKGFRNTATKDSDVSKSAVHRTLITKDGIGPTLGISFHGIWSTCQPSRSIFFYSALPRETPPGWITSSTEFGSVCEVFHLVHGFFYLLWTREVGIWEGLHTIALVASYVVNFIDSVQNASTVIHYVLTGVARVYTGGGTLS